MITKFKTGDRAICYTPPENWETGEQNRGGSGWEEGKEFTVGEVEKVTPYREVAHDETIYIIWPEKGGSGIYALWCRKENIIPPDLFEMS